MDFSKAATARMCAGHLNGGAHLQPEHPAVQAALDRERQRSSNILQRCKALEQDLEECAMDYEVCPLWCNCICSTS